LTLGDFRVEVLPAEHVTFLGWRPFSGPLPPDLRPPLRACDYRMDRCFGFLVSVGGTRLLYCPGPAVAAQVLVVKPLGTRSAYQALLRTVQPQVVVPIHWDDFGRPLSRPIRSMLAPSGRAVPPLRRIDLARFQHMVKQLAPQARVLIPAMFHTYELSELVQHGSNCNRTP
jgi:hypothetical protein